MGTLPITPVDIAAWILTIAGGIVLAAAGIVLFVMCCSGLCILLAWIGDGIVWVIRKLDKGVR